MFKEDPNQPESARMRRQAQVTLLFRVIAAGYLLYLAYGLARGAASGGASMPLWVQVLAAAVFAVAAVLLCVLGWRGYKRGVAAAKEAAEAEALEAAKNPPPVPEEDEDNAPAPSTGSDFDE